MKITQDQLRNAVGYGSIASGYEYFNKKKVLKTTINEASSSKLVLLSEVSGSKQNIYHQHIKVTKEENRLNLLGACSCPVQLNCKHVFAAMLYYIENLQAKDARQELNKWLDTLFRVAYKSIPSDYIQSEHFIAYRLFTGGNYHKKDLSFYKAKYLANGKIAKGVKISAEGLVYGHSYSDIVTKEDKPILELAKVVIPKFNNGESQEIKGELGYMLIKKMVQTNRCFFQQNQSALTYGGVIETFEFEWIDHENGQSKLALKLPIQQDLFFINTKPLTAIDSQNNRFYEFTQSLDVDVLKLLQNAPMVPKEHLNKLCEVISSRLPNLPLQVPKSFEVTKIQTKPVGVLRLAKNSVENGSYHYMALGFRYGEHLVAPLPAQQLTSLYENGIKVEIQRDIEAEVDMIEMLEEFGFESRYDQETFFFISLAIPHMQEALQRWDDFLNIHKPKLEQDGWEIYIDDSFMMKFEPMPNIEFVSSTEQSTMDWFEFSFDVDFNGQLQSLVTLVSPLIEQFESFEQLPDILNIQLEQSHYFKVMKDEIEPVLKTIFALYDKKQPDGKIKISSYEAHLIEDLEQNITFQTPSKIIELSKKLKSFDGVVDVEPSKHLQASLRQYQQEGLNWLGFLHEFGFGGVLADDMGLGKTIQTIAHLCTLKEKGELCRGVLIIMPTSLIANWKNEIAKFSTNLSVLSLHGSDRATRFDMIDQYDVYLTTYNLMARDYEIFEKRSFSYIILDEAQRIKNPRTKMAQVIRSLQSDHKLALSGTPIENHLGELWSLFHFLMPGFLGNQTYFRQTYQNPIETDNNKIVQEQLNYRIKPFMLRRTKEQVVLELPEKSEIIKYTQFDSKQAKLYETIRLTMEKKVQEAIESKGLNKSHITILDALLKLRQVCCDPSLLKIDQALKVKESTKLELFMDLVTELVSEGKKILVFSQFTSMLAILEKALSQAKINSIKLTGNTKNREAVINAFKNEPIDIFLISLKAGGVGLNLVEADTVIHYDPWWNPAVENQATDRAYRIGQTKAVFVYKLIVENSIEQKILQLQQKKQSLQNRVFEQNADEKDIFSGQELLDLLKGN